MCPAHFAHRIATLKFDVIAAFFYYLVRWARLRKVSSSNYFFQMGAKNNHINYVEFQAKNLEKIKAFYTTAFNWTFIDYGPTYIAFSNSGLEGGFEKTDDTIINGVLVVLYHKDLDLAKKNVIEAGGKITHDIFSFPGGRRFHFTDPSGNELAVWSDN